MVYVNGMVHYGIEAARLCVLEIVRTISSKLVH
jgi:hypothetical protein